MNKLPIPIGLTKGSWVPNWMLQGIVQSIGNDKMFGITITNTEATSAQHFDFGVTHVQSSVDIGQDFNHSWTNFRAAGLATPQDFANQFSTGNNNLSKYHGYGGQVQEDGFNPAQGRECFGRLYDKIAAADPSVQSPADTWLIGDYFSPLPGGKLMKALGDSSQYQKHRDNLASLASSRLKFNDGDNNFNGTDDFYTDGWGYAKQNGQTPDNYLNSWAEIRLGIHPYVHIFNLIKSRNGCPNRRLIQYDWSSYDNAGWGYPRSKARIRYENPPGVLTLYSQWHPIPHEIMKQRAFFNLLIGDGMVQWEVGGRYVNDPSRLDLVIDPNQAQWQGDGQSSVPYDRNASNQPHTPTGRPDPVFQDYPLGVGENGVATGVYMYGYLKQRGLVGNYVQWLPFTYSVDGGASQNGYLAGSTPVNGNNGNARLSNRATPNYGESNVVGSMEAGKPLVAEMVGPSGSSFFAVNPHGDPDQETVVTLPSFSNATFVLKGDELAVFTF